MNLSQQFLLPIIVGQTESHKPVHAPVQKPCYGCVGVYANDGSVLCFCCCLQPCCHRHGDPGRAQLHSPIPVIISPPQRSMPRPSLHVSLWRPCIIHDLITTSSGDGRQSTLRLMAVWRIMACHCCDFLTMRGKNDVLGLIKLL